MQLMMVTMMILVLIQATLAPIMKKPSFPVFEMKAAFAMMLFKDAPKSMPAAGSPTMMSRSHRNAEPACEGSTPSWAP